MSNRHIWGDAMRVVAGKRKGHPLKAVAGEKTRPTTDKVKEAVFQSIGPFFDGGSVLDLFAGSGSLGIEALSRGMDKAIFVDKHPKAIHTIKENLKAVKLENQAEVYKNDALRAIKILAKRRTAFDLILIDPPYQLLDYTLLVEELMGLGLIKEGGIIYCEHDPEDDIPMETEQLKVLNKKNYGKTIAVTIYQFHEEGV